MRRSNRWTMGSAAVMVCAVAVAAHAQVFTTLVSFNGQNGDQPYNMSLIQGRDANFYGTTNSGGLQDSGTVFRITSGGTLTTLYSFCAQPDCSDGEYPVGGLVLATDGSFFGGTVEGPREDGTIFKVAQSGELTTLYTFSYGGPIAALTQGTDGKFYGTTTGGQYGYGSVFKMTPGGVTTRLYAFDGTNGAYPWGKLIEGIDGSFYGTTLGGGQADAGTVFRITPAGNLTTIYSFCAQQGCADGGDPYAGLTVGPDGAFYGTAEGGGSNGGGTIFRITRAGDFAILYSFCAQHGCTDGSSPTAGLALGTDGNFYGATTSGGHTEGGGTGQGTIFKITPAGALTTLYSFCPQGYPNCTDGAGPYGGLIQATTGEFYGTTRYGGTGSSCDDGGEGCGTVFSLNTALQPFVAFVPPAGHVGSTGGILGQGFTGTTSVMLNGIPAHFAVVSDTFIKATVPSGATTGYVTVTTPTGVLTSNVPFRVIQ